jgi:hypothetical protein
MRVSIKVSFDMPPDSTRDWCRKYVEDAIYTHRGCLEPGNEDNNWTGDPMFYLDGNTLKVEFTKKGSF